jgi:hypothetical protein
LSLDRVIGHNIVPGLMGAALALVLVVVLAAALKRHQRTLDQAGIEE